MNTHRRRRAAFRIIPGSRWFSWWVGGWVGLLVVSWIGLLLSAPWYFQATLVEAHLYPLFLQRLNFACDL